MELLGTGSTAVGTPALAITHEGEHMDIRLADAAADPDRLVAELAAVGVDASVEQIPASPSRVGKWSSVEFSEGEGVEIIDDDEVLRVQEGTGQRIRIRVGRPAAPGEEYATSAGAFQPGEALHCTGVHEMTPAQAARAIRELGYRVSWRYAVMVPGTGSATGEGAEAHVHTPLHST